MNSYPPASFGPSQPGQTPPVVKRKPLSFWLALLFGACTLLGGGVILVLMLTMGSLASVTSGGSREGFQEKVVEGRGRAKIAWIPIHGAIMRQEDGGGFFHVPDPVDRAIKCLEQAADDADVKAVVLDVDSPGGGVTESDQIHHAVLKVKEAGKPVLVLMGNLAASGGYYVSAPADVIMAHPTTVTGSIGVIAQLLNVEELVQKIGVRPVTIKSGAHKDLGSMTRPMTEEERQIFQALIDDMYGKFCGIVLDGRSAVKLPGGAPFTEAHLRRIADGRIYTATQALELGLVDAIGYRDDVLVRARQMAGVKDARVIEYFHQPSLGDLLGARLPVSPLAGAGPAIRQALTPRFLFLWTGA